MFRISIRLGEALHGVQIWRVIARGNRMRQRCFDTPLGRMRATVEENALVGLLWVSGGDQAEDDPILDAAERQLAAYFDGTLTSFDLPLSVRGSAFQRAVCATMLAIPFGQTRTYGHIAAELGAQPQAVGQACGNNPIPVVIPCHRVLAANGLGGFSARGGIETKVALLRHEGAAGLLI